VQCTASTQTNNANTGVTGEAPASSSGAGRHVELLLAADFSEFSAACQSGRTESGAACSGSISAKRAAAQARAIKIANGVREIYASLSMGVTVTLVGYTAFESAAAEQSAGIYLGSSGSIDAYLDKWTAWWQSNNNGNTAADTAQLLSHTDRSGSTTGLAWVGTLCRAGYSSGVNEDKGLWQYTVETVAHELGHNFGAGHDSQGSAVSCPQSGYVMAAVGTVSYQFNRDWLAFSTCSRASIDETLQGLENTPTNCLANDPRAPIGGPVCGDGIVSGTEECDDGAAGSNLCHGASAASPCTQKGGVQCAFGECCDTNTGAFKAAGSLCRNAMHQVRRPLAVY